MEENAPTPIVWLRVRVTPPPIAAVPKVAVRPVATTPPVSPPTAPTAPPALNTF